MLCVPGCPAVWALWGQQESNGRGQTEEPEGSWCSPCPAPAAASRVPEESVSDSPSGPLDGSAGGAGSSAPGSARRAHMGVQGCAGLGTASSAAGGVIVGGTSQNHYHHPVTKAFLF